MSLNLPEPPEGMRIVSMIEFQGTVFVATERGVYKKVLTAEGDKFIRLKFEDSND